MKKDPIDYLLQYTPLAIIVLVFIIDMIAALTYATRDLNTSQTASQASAAFMELATRYGVPFVFGIIFCIVLVNLVSHSRKRKSRESLFHDFLNYMDGQ